MAVEPTEFLKVNEFSKWRHNLSGFFEITVDNAVNHLRLDMYEKFGEIVAKFKETDEDMEALFARVGVIEVTVDRIEKKVDALEQRVERIEQKVDALEQKVDALEQRVIALEQGFERIEQKVDAMEQKFNALDLNVKALEQKVERIEQKVDGVVSIVTLIAQALNVPVPANLLQNNNG